MQIFAVNFRNRSLLALDALVLAGAAMLAYAVRFEGLTWPVDHRQTALIYMMAAVPLKLVVFFCFGLYRRLWRHASIGELERILLAGVVAGVLCGVLGMRVLPDFGWTAIRVPISVLFVDAYLTIAFTAFPRLLARVHGGRTPPRPDADKPVLIAGAGSAGEVIVKELLANPQLGLNPIGFVDDDDRKHRHLLCNLPVLGSVSDIPALADRHAFSEVIVAMPSAPGSAVRRVLKAAREAGVRTRTMPGLRDILSGQVSVTALRRVEIQDLLRREPVRTNLHAVRTLATERTVLVTGAGGSIGGELCRQLAQLEPARVVVLGHGENSIFELLADLVPRYPGVHFVPVVADVRDGARVRRVVERYGPHAIFHAAAHKHVPLMEANAAEAVTNNVLGTRNVVEAAAEAGIGHFVLVSTDKAVRPTSVMGATKRVAEQIVQRAALQHHRNFVSVRFGNVLGSRGSVVPTFLRQIEAGGPVTVTHPEMRRYFMTIPEAVQLVLQAGALGKGGEVFVLDMGEPVRIVDLACDLIRLSGLELGKDIDLQFTGLRPGEKLYEEMFFSGENVLPTDHPKILRARKTAPADDFDRRLDSLIDGAFRGDRDADLYRSLATLVPDFDVAISPTPSAPNPSPVVSSNRPPVAADAH